jgi:hypothetical protein
MALLLSALLTYMQPLLEKEERKKEKNLELIRRSGGEEEESYEIEVYSFYCHLNSKPLENLFTRNK